MIWIKGDLILMNTATKCVKKKTVRKRIAHIRIIKFNKYTILRDLKANFAKSIIINQPSVSTKNFVLLLIPKRKLKFKLFIF